MARKRKKYKATTTPKRMRKNWFFIATYNLNTPKMFKKKYVYKTRAEARDYRDWFEFSVLRANEKWK